MSGVDKDEFLNRLRRSGDRIDEAGQGKVTSGLFTAHCGGEAGWAREYADMKARIESAEFGLLEERILIQEIATARRPLYERWYPSVDAKDEFFRNLVVAQGIEYAAMGKIIAEKFRNPLVLGADHHRMSPFYNLAADIPVIYLDRNYE